MLTKTSRVLASTAVAALAVATPLSSAPALATSGPTLTVLASGLDNPRGLAWSHNHLYVAQAGHGGTDCPAGATGPEGGPLCVGMTGSLGIVSHGAVQPVLHNLISLSDLPGGVASIGLAAVTATKAGIRIVFNESVLGMHEALAGGTLTPEDSAAARKELGRVATLTPHLFQVLADPGDADFTWSAIHQDMNAEFPDADPNALVVLGNKTYVADAASNTLDEVSDNGAVKQVAYFPNVGASNSVPTCVAVGPADHNLYVGLLAPGAAPGGGKVYKYVPSTHKWSVWRSGFNPINGCGFDSKGNFYAVEFQSHGFNPGPTGNPAGDIVKITPKGQRSIIGDGQLFFPSGFAADHAGNIYVSNWSIMTATGAPGAPTGQVVKITP